MIGISQIGSYIPEHRESNLNRKEEFAIDEKFILEKLGVKTISRKSAREETSDMCAKAFDALKGKTAISKEEIECLVVCTQNPDGHGIPHTSAIVHGLLKLPEHCACFDISLGCSGYVYSLSVVRAFMKENGMKKGLLFTADPYSKIIDPHDKNTALLFGDAATVTLLEEAAPGQSCWIPKAFDFATKGQDSDALHNREKYLRMNGRSIFNFSMNQVPQQIEDLLKREKLTISDIDLFLIHQGSRYMVEQLQGRLNIDKNKVPINLSNQGNTVSSSIPLLLEEHLFDESLKRIVLSGFGVGLSWATCLLTRQGRK